MRSCVVLNYIDWAHLGLPEHRDDWKIYTNLALIKYSTVIHTAYYLVCLCTIPETSVVEVYDHRYKRAILYTTLGSNHLDYLGTYSLQGNDNIYTIEITFLI